MKAFGFLQIATAMIVAITLTSCGDIVEPDGKWDDMIWKTELQATEQDGAYIVAATGGELIFSCKNYSKPWIAEAKYAGEYYHPFIKVNENAPTGRKYPLIGSRQR